MIEECEFLEIEDEDYYKECSHPDNNKYNGQNGSGFCLDFVCPLRKIKFNQCII